MMQHTSQQKTSSARLEKRWNDSGIVIGNLATSLPELITNAFGDQVLIVSDLNTHKALAHHCDALPHMVFPSPPLATNETVETLRQHSTNANATALIAIGSGTLNDLCKYASFLDNKPYAVAATAPSMNGYLSGNASISIHGYKKTLTARPPMHVWCDLATLTSAPTRLIQAGLGDTLCRSTVQYDWLLSHLVTGSRYDAEYFEWMIPCEQKLITHAERLVDGDETTITLLIESLLLSGLAMRDHGSSAPASQAEHMLAHTMEMLSPDRPPHYHGEEIAVTSLSTSHIQQTLLNQHTPPTIRYYSDDEIRTLLPPHLCEEALTHYRAKLPSAHIAQNYCVKLANEWPAIQQQLRNIHLPTSKLHRALHQAKAPLFTSDLEWNNHEFSTALRVSPLTRDRFTCLDLLSE